MPLKVETGELAFITDLVAAHSSGVSVGELQLEVEEKGISRRTLQRRLGLLVENGQLRPVGEGRGRRYVKAFSPPQHTPPPSLRVKEDTEKDEAWLSPESEELQRQIRRPVHLRRPVGYHGEFLATYLPNESFYLPSELREELHALGKVGVTELPAGTYVRQILSRLLIDLSWNSSRLEGNTYSLLETERLLNLGEMVEGKAAREAQMILNHKAAIEMLADPAEETGMNRYTLCNLHALLADNLLPDAEACGRIRERAVGISGSVFLPLEMPQEIEARFDQILLKANAITDPFEQAFFCMVHLPYLQPFEDVNKRVSRLSANIPLIRENLCPLSFIDVPQEEYLNAILAVYELNRVEYLRDLFVWAYRRSADRFSSVREQLGDPDPFRLKHRTLLADLVRNAVVGGLHGEAARVFVKETVATHGELTPAEMKRFVEVVAVELGALHFGNIARYKIRPGDFERWEITSVAGDLERS